MYFPNLAGFNISGGLRGLEFVLDSRRTNSIQKQNSEDSNDEENIEQTYIEREDNNMGATTSVENPSTSKEELGPSLQDIYEQRQPPQIRRLLNRWDSSLESRDSAASGPLLSSRDSTSESDWETFDLLSRNSSLDANLRLSRDQDFNNAKDGVSSGVGYKDVFQSLVDKSCESSVEQDSANVSSVSSGADKSDPNGNLPVGALSEEQRNQIREELMLRAQIVRARMMIPEPQLAPVDEESESESHAPYRTGSLDTASEDGRKLSVASEEDLQDDKNKSSNMLRTMSTPELEMHYGRTQKKSPPQGGKKPINPPASQKEVKGQSSSSGDDSNKLKPIPHKVAERLLKDTGHAGGGQESFEIEEVSMLMFFFFSSHFFFSNFSQIVSDMPACALWVISFSLTSIFL